MVKITNEDFQNLSDFILYCYLLENKNILIVYKIKEKQFIINDSTNEKLIKTIFNFSKTNLNQFIKYFEFIKNELENTFCYSEIEIKIK